MTSIDELFRKPSSTSTASSVLTGNKRKYPEPPSFPSPSSTYKSAKTTANGSPHSFAPTVEDNDDDIEAGPALPPEAEEEDDEGRFFGSGVSAHTKDALDYVEGVEGEDATAEEVIDGAWLRKMAIGLEKRVNKNAELRAKFGGEPEKYVRLALAFLIASTI